MHKTRVIALDIYDTVLCDDDPENAMPPRKGIGDFIRLAKSLGIRVVTSSDAPIEQVMRHLDEVFLGRVGFGIEIFDGFFRLQMKPKKYGEILRHFGIQNEELMVIGDSQEKDLSGAPINSTLVLVPPYEGVTDKFDFMSIPIP